ncbi:PAS domain S-box protein [Curvibacter sp. APW13]|uniref:PAS domain S-box protein n=1 Tax=Curvibacter sp. APW13 TaxID=3077236 RepID=UPI0028DEEFB5|nr:PAS domain S-box protein [Curvibacter sp. APW13]MDT8989843.1 PAS domain S-box protein [Curvibacter sp. APW13]
MPRSHWTSLSVRIVVGAQLIFLVSVWTLAWYANGSLRADMEREIGEHQRAELVFLGRRLEARVADLLGSLRVVGADIPMASLADRQALAQLLAQRPLLARQFNGGVAILNAEGTVVAATSQSLHRPGAPLNDNHAVTATLQSGQVGVGPTMAAVGASGIATLTLSIPLAVRDGRPQGALVGTILLNQPGVLGQTELTLDGQGLKVVLADLQQRTIFLESGQQGRLKPMPAAERLAPLDRLRIPEDGTAIYTGQDGIEVLGTGYHTSTLPWYLVVTQPTEVAFAPLELHQRKLLTAAALLSLFALLVGVPWLRRELRPIRDTAVALRAMGTGQQAQQPLPIPPQADVAELVAGFNGLLATLTERETLLRDLFNTSSVGILLVNTEARITQANAYMGELFHCSVDDLMGMEYAELVAPVERDAGRTRTLALLAGRFETVDIDRQFLRRDGSIFWGRLTGRRMFGPDQQLRGLVGTITDITERKLLQQFENFRSQTLERLARDEPLEKLLLATVAGLEDILPQSMCSCILLTPDGQALGRSFGPRLPHAYHAALQGLPIGPHVGSCGASAYLGQRVVVDNIATHPNWAPYRELAAMAGLGACWSQPVIGSDGRVLGTFAVYHATPHTPGNIDILLIEQVAKLVAIAIERSNVAQRLRESEEHFRLLTEGVDDVVWRLDAEHHFTYISPADERMRGFAASEVIGHHVFEIMTPAGIEVIRNSILSREADEAAGNASDTRTLVLEQVCKDGSTVWTEIRSTAERDAQGRISGYRGVTRNITARRAIEARLHLAASVMTYAQEGIMITSAQGTILDVNQAFCDITGYAREEAMGADPSMLKSDRHDAAFYRAIMDTLQTQGRWHGEFWNRRKNGELYIQRGTISAVTDAQGVVQHYVSVFSDVTELREQQQQLEHRAHYDALTDLPNRVLMMDRLRQAMVQAQRRGQPLALVFLDLDGFKPVNDLHGHAVGDALLQVLAARMRSALRDGDTLARLGGDEFIAILVDLPEHDASTPLLLRLLQAVAHPVQIAGHTLQVSASLGVSFFPQSDEVDADTLLRQADHAMYRAKLAGKNRFQRYDPSDAP